MKIGFSLIVSIMSTNKLLKKYIEYGKKSGYWRRGMGYKFRCKHQIFKGINFKEKNFLDIGCGNGRFSIWATIHRASKTLGLEPTLKGSRNESVSAFKDAVEHLKLNKIDITEKTFQDFDSPDSYWDIVLLCASINHLSEEACITLRENQDSQRNYMNIFSKLYSVVAPGGLVIITDCSSENKYANLGIPNPYAPSIEWHKHQPPEVWAEHLQKVGFVNPGITWLSPAQYLYFGLIFLTNYFYSYRRASMFRLEVSKPRFEK